MARFYGFKVTTVLPKPGRGMRGSSKWDDVLDYVVSRQVIMVNEVNDDKSAKAMTDAIRSRARKRGLEVKVTKRSTAVYVLPPDKS